VLLSVNSGALNNSMMVPQHFKALVRSLNETLEAYEAVYGVLQIPDTDTAPQKNAEEIAEAIEDARAKAKESAIPSSTEPPPPSRRSRGAAQKKET
jgi:hypothetical protein